MGRPTGSFDDVGEFNATWEPKKTGSKKDQNYTPLQADPGKSWLYGYYAGTEEVKTKDGFRNSHSFKVIEVGDKNHIVGDFNNGMVSMWGSGVLDSLIQKSKESGKIIVGSPLFIEWLGIAQPKKADGRPYHNWKVQISTDKEPYDFGTPGPISKAPADAGPVSNEKVNADVTSTDDDDDVPF